MDNKITWGESFAQELEMESAATRRCLEKIPESLFEWKPADKSMKLGSLAIIVADIPRWITHTIEKSEIDFATYEQFRPKTGAELSSHFEEVLKEALEALRNAPDEKLQGMFYLKNQGQELMSMRKKESVGSTINHLVHHRGQLTVYMRLNNLPVPSIYGPSADEPAFS